MPLNLRLSNAYLYAGDGLHSGHDCEIALLWGLSRSPDGMLMFANEISLRWSWPSIIFCSPVDEGRAVRILAPRRPVESALSLASIGRSPPPWSSRRGHGITMADLRVDDIRISAHFKDGLLRLETHMEAV